MALQIGQTQSVKVKFITTLMMVLAIAVQPVYGFVASRIASAATLPMINEVMPAPTGSSEWVEVYNPSHFNLEDYSIKDDDGHSASFTSANTATYAVLAVNMINNGGDVISLHDAANTAIDTITVPSAVSYYDQSYGRGTDGATNLQWFATPTKGATNAAAPVPVPNTVSLVSSTEDSIKLHFTITHDNAGADNATFETESDPGTTLPSNVHPDLTLPVGYNDDITFSNVHSWIKIRENMIDSNGNGVNSDWQTFNVQPAAAKPVENSRTHEMFDTIQAAIADSDTTAGDTIDLNQNITVPAQVNVNKSVTIDGQGNTVSVDGTGYRFLITANGAVLKNLNVTKTDKAGVQNIVGIQADNVTIDSVHFTGQFNIGDGETERALEISSVSNVAVKNSTFNHLRQPAYINTATGTFENNYVSDTKGWVLVASSNIHFTGNTWGTNVTDIAIIDDDGNAATPVTNNYTCAIIAQIKSDNNNASIDNQVLTSPCDTTAPTITVKTGASFTIGSAADKIFSKVSFSLHDSGKIAKYDINGTPTNVSPSTYSDANYIGVGKHGAVYGQNVLTAYDAAGNTSTYSFVLDNAKPDISVKSSSVGSLTDNVFSKADFKLHDQYKISRYQVNGGAWHNVTPNTYGDANDISVGHNGGIYGSNTITLEDLAGNQATYGFELDNVTPTITPQNYVGSTSQKTFSKVSFGFYDHYKIDKYAINGHEINLSNAVYSNANFQNFASYLHYGVNVLTLSDESGNTAEYDFTYDNMGPTISVKNDYTGDKTQAIFSQVSFSLYDAYQVDKYVINGHSVDFSNNKWSDANFQNIKQYLVQDNTNTLVLYDVAGNNTTYEFTYDDAAPSVVHYAYSNNGNLTKDDVTVTITTSEPVTTPTDWTKVDDTHFTKVFEHNGGFYVDLTDMVDNAATVGGKGQGAEVKRIDKNTPVISGVADGATVTDPVHLSITDPSYEGADGFDANHGLNVNGTDVATTPGANKTYLYDITADGTYTVIATDKAGNPTQPVTFTIATQADSTTPGGGSTNGGNSATNTSGASQASTTGTTDNANLAGTRNRSLLAALNGNNGQFLADNTTTPAADTQGDVLGTSDSSKQGMPATHGDDQGQVKGASTTTWNILGFAWYWWLLLLAIIAGLIWWLVAARRRRSEA